MIPISFERERIQNVALFFVKNTKNVSVAKLCKLFYFLDMEEYLKTGFPVTGLQYRAKSRGPVPIEIWADVQNKKAEQYTYFDLNEVIRKVKPRSSKATEDETILTAKKNKDFNPVYFSESELKALEVIAQRYVDSSGTEMSEESHLKEAPWEQTWRGGEGEGQVIDFDLEAKAHFSTEGSTNRRELQHAVQTQLGIIKAL